MSEFWNKKTVRIILSILVALIIWLYADSQDTDPRTVRVNDVPVEFTGEDVLMERGLLVTSVIQASCPVAANTVLFAVQYGGDSQLASKTVAVSTVLSMETSEVGRDCPSDSSRTTYLPGSN